MFKILRYVYDMIWNFRIQTVEHWLPLNILFTYLDPLLNFI